MIMVMMTVHMIIKNNMMAINEIDDNDNNDGALCEHRWRSDHNWNQVVIGTIFFLNQTESNGNLNGNELRL